MAEEGHIPPRNHGQKEASAPMEYGTPPEILPIEMAFNFPLFPSPFTFTSLWLFFGTLTSLLIIFGFWHFFWTSLATMTFSVPFYARGASTFFFYSFKFYGGTFKLCCVITTKKLLPQSGRTQLGSKTYSSPQSGRTQPGSNLFKSTKWTDPTRVKTTVHIMEGPNKGQKLTQVHKVDRPHQGSRQQST